MVNQRMKYDLKIILGSVQLPLESFYGTFSDRKVN